MCLANQSSRKLDKLSQSLMGGTPQIKGKATDPRGVLESREAEWRGTLGQGQSRI